MPVRLACLIPLTFFFAAAQTFEVASVKRAASYKGGAIHIATTGGPGTDDPNRLTFSNATLPMVLQTAFDLQDDAKISGPDWLPSDMFDIEAIIPPATTKDQMRTMLQNLVAERFHMAWHREKHNLPAYFLSAAKGRVRLPAPKDAASKSSHKNKELPGIRTITCGNCTVNEFAKMLGVFDETGLSGTYDFALTYEPDYGVCKGCESGGQGGASPAPPPPLDQAPPILSVALDQQLGLKLEKKQRLVDVLVIDRVDRVPVAN